MGEANWSPTPGTETLATLQKFIAGYVLMPTDPEVLETARAGIRRAVDRLNARPWSWLITYDDIPFRVGTSDDTGTEYPLTSWFKSPRNFELWDASNRAVDRLQYKQWKTFLMEHANLTWESQPTVYSCSNVNAFGSVSLNASPSQEWVDKYPNGRLWYYRKAQYPNAPADAIDCPSEFVGFVQASAEGFTADRYAVAKAPAAYQRAERFLHELVVDDAHGGQTDWE